MDNQLPVALARWLTQNGHQSVHVLDLGMESVSDTAIWDRAVADEAIVVSKDEDFFHLANRPRDLGRLLWIRVGNCRTGMLLERFSDSWSGIESAFASGERIVILM